MHDPTCTSCKPHEYSQTLQIETSYSTFLSSTLISMLDIVQTFYSHEVFDPMMIIVLCHKKMGVSYGRFGLKT
jgi:hypothetical protein